MRTLEESPEECDLTELGSYRPLTLLEKVRSKFGPGSEGTLLEPLKELRVYFKLRQTLR